MAQLCGKCSRSNPAEAVYCYFDGFVLAGRERRGGPLLVGSQPFNSPFVFPTGRTCRSFDELALACQEEWTTACSLLRDGYLESFFGGLGRVDLALVAKEAARFPDPERGLDQVLAKLPTGVLADPHLHIHPLDVNLGVMDSDEGRTFELELENRGMRLVYGTVTSDAVWLTFAEGASEKHFHFTHEAKIPVRVRPELARAGPKPIEGRLTAESNAGTVTVLVRATKPIKPFPDGVLKGAKTPRQIAEKARDNQKDVAPLFESGAVAQWYASNGWTYPVKIPAASGLAAIQQFFEALGFVKPPKVDISRQELSLSGSPGDKLPLSIEVSSQEKKPVFAHVTSNVPWLEVSRPKFNGRIVTVNMSVPTVPNRPGERLEGELTVISNGNQRFTVPVRLDVAGSPGAVFAEMGDGSFDFTHDAPAPPAPAPPPPVKEEEEEPPKKKPEKKAPPPRRRGPQPTPLWVHAIPAAFLALAVAGVVAYDVVSPRANQLVGDEQLPKIAGVGYDPKQLRDPKPRIGVQFNGDQRFGVVMLDADDPGNKGKWKRLTFAEDGSSNNTIVKIGSSEYKYGFRTPQNRWRGGRRELAKTTPYHGWSTTMDFTSEQIRVTQFLQIVPGQTMLLDTLLIYYQVHNYGTIPQNVALRVMLDTYIGDNDGVPFTAPGSKGFVTDKAEYKDADVPDYLEAVEKPENEKDPGTTVRVGLRGLKWSETDLVEPDRVVICKFPGGGAGWDWELENMGNDSAVAVYWPERKVEPRETKHLAMTYGLGKLDISDSLALSAPNSVLPDREFVVTAYVYNAVKGQKVRIELPEGVNLTGGSEEVTIGEDAKRTQVFWKVRASKEGTAVIEAVSGKARARKISVQVKARSILG
jgi:hypothetical protein